MEGSRSRRVGLRDAVKKTAEVGVRSIVAKLEGKSTFGVGSNSILAACAMAYPERCDIKQEVERDALPVLMRYVMGYNDWVDVGEDLPEGNEFRDYFESELEKHKAAWYAYLDQMPNREEADALRLRTDQIMGDLATIEGAAKCVEGADNPYREELDLKELANGVDAILGIIACVDHNMFADRMDTDHDTSTIEGVKAKYAWLVDLDYEEVEGNELTEDEKRARMLYLASMAAQMQNDISIYDYDKALGVVKPINVLTDVVGLSKEDAIERTEREEARYIRLAKKYGFKRRVIKIGDIGYRAGNDWLHGIVDLARSQDPDSVMRKLIAAGFKKTGCVRQEMMVNRDDE